MLCRVWHFWAKNEGWTISAVSFSSLRSSISRFFWLMSAWIFVICYSLEKFTKQWADFLGPFSISWVTISKVTKMAQQYPAAFGPDTRSQGFATAMAETHLPESLKREEIHSSLSPSSYSTCNGWNLSRHLGPWGWGPPIMWMMKKYMGRSLGAFHNFLVPLDELDCLLCDSFTKGRN